MGKFAPLDYEKEFKKGGTLWKKKNLSRINLLLP